MQLISMRFMAPLLPTSASGYTGAGPACWRAQCPRGPWGRPEGAPGPPASCVGRRDVWACHLLEVQRPCAGTEAGDTPDCTVHCLQNRNFTSQLLRSSSPGGGVDGASGN